MKPTDKYHNPNPVPKHDRPILEPMLARTFSREALDLRPGGRYIVQPKLDGYRCLTYYSHRPEFIFFQSRNLKPIHPGYIIQDALFDFCRTLRNKLPSPADSTRGFWLDGELYIHGRSFQELQSIISKKDDDCLEKTELQYHIYDTFIPNHQNLSFEERYFAPTWQMRLTSDYSKNVLDVNYPLRLVESKRLKDVVTQAGEALDEFVHDGYEGVIIRHGASPYEAGKRSGSLLKYKKFLEEDYEVIAIEEGKGKNAGTAVLTCIIPRTGAEFTVTAPGSYDLKRKIFLNQRRYIGRMLSVKFQELTNEGIPRFPIALGFKEDR